MPIDPPVPSTSRPPQTDRLSPVFVTATPLCARAALAHALWQGLSSVRPARPGGIDLLAWQRLQQIGEAPASSRIIVFVDRPALMLAHWSAQQSDSTSQQALALWCDGVRRLLGQAHRRPDQWLFIDAEEALAAPEALAAALARWDDSLALADVLPLAAPDLDNAALALAEAAVRCNPAAARLAQELEATCTVLVERWSPPPADAHEALAQVVASRLLFDAEASRGRELAASLQQMAQADAAARTAAARTLQAAESRRLALERDLAAARIEAEQAQQDLQRMRQDLQALAAENSAAQARAAALKVAESGRLALERDLAAARTGAEQAQQGLRQDLQRMRQDLQALAAESSAAQARAAALQDTLERSHREDDLALLRLHEMQETLEEQHALLQQQRAPGFDAAAHQVHAAAVVELDSHDVPPHRHLNYALQNVRFGLWQLPRLEIRLLEHHGKPGLAMFRNATAEPAISAWRPDGSEAGHEFMLLIPGDAAGADCLLRLGARDWRFVTGLVDLLRTQLKASGHSEAARWRWVATRLSRQLASLTDRLRFDAVVVTARDETASTLQVAFEAAEFGGNALGTLTLHWSPASGGLAWLAPAEPAALPIGAWPVSETGELAPTWPVPVGRDCTGAEQRRRWSQLAAREQALLLAVLDALPAAAQAAPPHAPGRAGLAAAAMALHRGARRTLAALRLRATARRLLRRATARG